MNLLSEAPQIVATAIARGWAKMPEQLSEDEYKRMRREKNTESMRNLRNRWMAQGLTSNGKPRKYKAPKARQ